MPYDNEQVAEQGRNSGLGYAAPHHYDDDDLSAADMAAAGFGPSTTTPGNEDDPRVAKHPFAQELNGVDKDFPFDNPPGPLSEQDAVLVTALSAKLARMLRNANVTAALPAHVKPIVWSDPLDVSDRIVLPAAASLNWTTLVGYTIPPGHWGRIDGYGFDIVSGAFTYDGSIAWRVIVNGLPQNTLNFITEHRGSLLRPREVFIRVEQDFRVELQVRRVTAAGAGTTIDGTLKGWQWRLRNDYEGTRAATTAY